MIYTLISCCFGPEPWVEHSKNLGYIKIYNKTNNLIIIYLNDKPIDTLPSHTHHRYDIIHPLLFPCHTVEIKREEIDYRYMRIVETDRNHWAETPLYFKGIRNDSIIYEHDINPPFFPISDSIIIFDDKMQRTIRGVVKDSVSGKGIIGSMVATKLNQWTWTGVVTDSMGNYQISILCSDTLTIKATHPYYETTYVKTSATVKETTIVNFSLKPTGFTDKEHGILTGRVNLGVADKPSDGASVSIDEIEFIVMSDRYGRYVIYNIPVGTYEIIACYLAYDPGMDTNVVIKPNQTTIRNFMLQETPNEIR